MPCFSPLEGFRGRMRSASGKRPIVFTAAEGYLDMPVKVPCGQCVGCRLERSRQWAIRIMHEASLGDENCFVTLTYDDVNLPPGGSLDRAAFPKFMKRLRKRFDDKRIRYFHCGEYGDLNGRPHYHACLFGIDFDDRVLWAERKGHPVYRSPSLEKAWKFGASEIGSLTFESAGYVARYVMKKVNGKDADKHYERVDVDSGELFDLEPEYASMSRRPGIGAEWIAKYGEETYRDDTVVMRGREMRPPKFYDQKYDLVDCVAVEAAKLKRQKARCRADESAARLVTREACVKARLLLQERGL